MERLHRSRCINHAGREAVARCPVCGHFFCRECVTEHEGRVICAACLQQEAGAAVSRESTEGLRQLLRSVNMALRVVAGIVLLWIVFYAAGQVLLAIPSDFHSGEIWSLR